MAGTRAEDEQIEIKYKHPIDKGGWAIVYHAITLDKRLRPHGVFRLYVLLHKYAQQSDRAWPKRSTLAADLGVSEDTIWRWMAKLEEVRLIERKKERFIGPPTIYLLDPRDEYFRKMHEGRENASFAENIATDEERAGASFVDEERENASFVPHEERVFATPNDAFSRHEEIIIEQKGGGEKGQVREKKESDPAQAIASALEAEGVFHNTAKMLGQKMAAEGISPEEALEIWRETVSACLQVRPRGRQLTSEEAVAMAVARMKRGDGRKRADETVHRAQFSAHDPPPIRRVQETDDGIWRRALGLLRLELTQATFNELLSPTREVECQGDRLTVAVPSEAARSWIEGRLRARVEEAVARAAGRPLEIEFVVGRD